MSHRALSYAFASTLYLGLATAQAVPPLLHWYRGHGESPSPRYGAAMAYDLHRGTMVLFGGASSQSVLFGDTWEFDGSEWQQRSPAHAPRPGAHAMVYDVMRRRMVLLAIGNPMQTWQWDGSDWTLAATGGITPRVSAMLAFDLLRGVTVAFGGAIGPVALGDTWEWDGGAWTLRATAGPSPRLHGAIAYDLGRGVTVLFGGQSIDARPLGGTFEWNGTAWVDRNVPEPVARTHAEMAYDYERQRCVLVGGVDRWAECLRETWEWNGDWWSRTSEAMPMAGAIQPALAYDVARNRMIVHGGGGPFFSSEPGWWIGTSLVAPAAAAEVQGAGCGSAPPRLRPLPDQVPSLGGRCRLEVADLPPGGLALGLAGAAPANGAVAHVPLDPYGFAGCALALVPQVTTVLSPGAPWVVPVPWAPGLLGVRLDLQAIAALGNELRVGNGLRLTVGL